ncbi:MAG: 1,4-dihydroxy-2-naphthoyl-CoA hydrolase [Frankiaceae bacterium]|jgi:uncharacterized protein (TIGR00369 family)|nr:1,4-dihydroxy-2-naphthoyl-CoA hydrolase [Frankiaceae bacterium]MDX6225451.1 1,4-dihydroxy-2-naphthoyl-CoA hydrolase [Frankiales bacterium]MDX6274066.1 1,4-dihydroxy-2-naphthoyl-CoA hydrolase [Frankiales bacterium]
MADAPRTDIDGFMEQKGELAERMGIAIVDASAERIVMTMPVEGNRQPFGLLHGGATGVLIETAGSIAGTLHGMTMGKVALGVELSVSHHRSAKDGLVTCTATALSLGGTLASYQCEVTDAEGRRVATGRLTCVLRTM